MEEKVDREEVAVSYKSMLEAKINFSEKAAAS